MTDGQSIGKSATLPCVTSPETSRTERFQPPEVRRRQILDALARLAVTDGLDKVSIADVAGEAGIAKGSIYLHYASRTDLIAALQADLWDRMLTEPVAIVADRQSTWGEKLDRLVEHWVSFEFDHHELYHAVFHTTGHDIAEPWTPARRLLREVLDQGSRAGEFDVVDLDTTTDFLLHAYGGPCYHATNRARIIDTLKRLFRRTVAAADSAGDRVPGGATGSRTAR